jgi:hypothetical protein
MKMCVQVYSEKSVTIYPVHLRSKGKGKSVPLQAWSGPEVSRNLRFPDFMTTARDDGKVVSLTHRPLLPPRQYTWYSFLLEVESTTGHRVRPERVRH